jgi:DNA-binding response OmpR family regulator
MEKLRVLMVDDETEFLRAMVKVLRKRGMDACGEESGQAALDRMEKEAFDVVILDFMMPGLDGMEALRRIKRKWPDTEVIMLTAVGSVEAALEGMRNGAFDYVLKPAEIDDLMEKIRQAGERKSLHKGEAP